MSAIFKGTTGPVLVSDEPFFDAETGIKYFDRTWAGSQAAVFGLAQDLENQNISYQTFQGGPVYTITARVPWTLPDEIEPDRYEITTEAADKSIFEFPTVIDDAEAYDAALADGALTYRKRVEEAVNEEDIGPTSTFQSVVRHLKAGVTGWQIDFLTLRRFRRVNLAYAYAAGKFNLSDGSLIYSTGQLNLPASVAFSLPTTPAGTTDFEWGWRKRGQRVDILGNFAEQTVELVFAPWSTFLYTSSGGNLIW